MVTGILYLEISYVTSILSLEIKKNGYFVKEALFYFVLFYKEVSDNLMSFSQERQKIFRTTFLIHSPSGDTKGFIL